MISRVYLKIRLHLQPYFFAQKENGQKFKRGTRQKAGLGHVRKAARDKKAIRDTVAEGNTSKGRSRACSYCRIGKKAVGDAAADPKKKTECSQGKDNTLKGAAERLKSVKPHGTKKQFVIQSLRGIRQKAGLGHVRIAA